MAKTRTNQPIYEDSNIPKIVELDFYNDDNLDIKIDLEISTPINLDVDGEKYFIIFFNIEGSNGYNLYKFQNDAWVIVDIYSVLDGFTLGYNQGYGNSIVFLEEYQHIHIKAFENYSYFMAEL